MGRIKDLLLRKQNEQDQPNPNEINLSFNDQWFLLTTIIVFITHSKNSNIHRNNFFNLFIL